jgi:hypothetical protein
MGKLFDWTVGLQGADAFTEHYYFICIEINISFVTINIFYNANTVGLNYLISRSVEEQNFSEYKCLRTLTTNVF